MSVKGCVSSLTRCLLMRVFGWQAAFCRAQSRTGLTEGKRGDPPTHLSLRWGTCPPSHCGFGAGPPFLLGEQCPQTRKGMCFSIATFQAEVWGFLWSTLPLTWQTQGAVWTWVR